MIYVAIPAVAVVSPPKEEKENVLSLGLPEKVKVTAFASTTSDPNVIRVAARVATLRVVSIPFGLLQISYHNFMVFVVSILANVEALTSARGSASWSPGNGFSSGFKLRL